MSYNAREDLLSSPDPLNDSPTFSSPTKRQYMARPRNSFPLQESSPRKQVFELDVGDEISSQKIKVTVEAEHSEKENSNVRFKSNTTQSPTILRAPVTRRNERTTTTTVPIKGLSESEDDTPNFPAGTPKRGRGRPRKSISSPGRSRSRTRAATPGAKPAYRGRKTLGSLVDGDDKNDWDFAIGTSDEINRKKGRSRSKKRSMPSEVTSNAKNPSLSVKEASSAAKSRGRRKTLGPEEVLIFEDNSGHIRQNKQDGDVIAQTEASNIPVPSAFSTIRSTTTISDDTPDILLATFDQAKPTPAKVGWSSPDVVQDFGSVLHNTRPDTTSLPLTMPRGIKSQLDCKQDAQRDYIESGDKVENAVRELREFDTILESEGFSMISVDSVPSLREHFSSPLNAGHINEGNINGAKEQFFVQRPGTLEAVTPIVEVSKPKMLYSKLASAAGKEALFSSVPSGIPEAATPKLNLKDTKSLSPGLSEREMTGVSLTASKPEVRKSSTAAKGMENEILSIQVNHMRINDNSFSSIPSAILEEATPARHPGEGCTLLNGRSQTESSSTAHAPLLKVPAEAVAGSTNQTPSSSRLLTPEDTPTPPEASQPHGKGSLSKKDAGDLSEISMEPVEGSSIIDSYVKSSPPVIVPKSCTYTAHLRQQQILHPEITETSSIVFSSPVLPPLMKQVPPKQEQGSREGTSAPSRPVLPPIVRAGRALQDITIPAAPRVNTQNLHSTFPSASSQRLLSGTSCKTQSLDEKRRTNNKLAESKRKGIEGDICCDDTGEVLQKTFMINEGLSHSQSTNSQLTRFCDGASQDDSISSSQRNISTAESDGKLGLSSEPPNQNRALHSESHAMANKEDSVRIDSAMSWQLEDTATVKSFTADAGAGQNQAIGISSENDNEPEDEEDIWQIEARHSSSVDQSRCRGVESRKKPVHRQKRSKIPSPWRKNSKRLLYSDELAKSSASPSFESKTAISKAVSKDKSSKGPIRLSSVIQTRCGDEDILEPSVVWNLPQKSNFSPEPQAPSQLNLSALLATSPTKEPPRGLFEASAQDASLPGKNLMTTQLKNKPQNESNLVVSPSVTKQVKNGESLTPKNPEHENAVDCFADSIKEHETESGSSLDESQMGLENSIQCSTLSTSRLSSSPANSCLRNSSVSARKSVAFTSTRNQKATDSPLTPPTPPLSANSWSEAHWRLLDSFYQDSKIQSSPCRKEAKAGEKSKYLGRGIISQGTSLILQQWHLDIVARFIYDERVAPGWDEGIVAKRLFAIIVAEERRAKGEI